MLVRLKSLTTIKVTIVIAFLVFTAMTQSCGHVDQVSSPTSSNDTPEVPSNILAPEQLQVSLNDSTTVHGNLDHPKSGQPSLVFKGIPYAQPPVGNLRWQAPQPLTELPQEIIAKNFKPICAQRVTDKELEGLAMSEDCLYLNLWRPLFESAPLDKKLPVIVWIHGGGFVQGAAHKKAYHGLELANQDTVFVSMNYRLNHFGFFAHPGQQQGKIGGNLGILDQIAALQWVQKNIASFGGDPGNVTIVGESAGGVSVLTHYVSPLSKGLFKRAVVESGPVLTDLPTLTRPSLKGDPSAFSASQQLAKNLDCQNEQKSLEYSCLKNRTSEEIIENIKDPGDVGSTSGIRAGLYVDRKTIPDYVYKLLKDGTFSRVPLIVGSNADEATYFGRPPVVFPAGFRRLLNKHFGESTAEKIFNYYNPSDISETRQAYLDFLTDYMFTFDALYMAKIVSSHGVPVYHYQFSRVSPGAKRIGYGASHGFEIPYFLKTLNHIDAKEGTYDEIDQRLAVDLSERLISFASKGDPNIAGRVNWPSYHLKNNKSTLVMDDENSIVVNFFGPGYLLYSDVKSNSASPE